MPRIGLHASHEQIPPGRLFGDNELSVAPGEPLDLDLRPYDHRWFRVRRKGRRLAP
jgi:hypothetical protein